MIAMLTAATSSLVYASGQQQSTTTGPNARTFTMSVATFHNKRGTPEVDGLFEFKKLVESRTNNVKVKVFFGPSMGGERSLVEQTKLGTIDMAPEGWTTKGEYLRKVCPWGVPYLFSSWAQIQTTIQGRIGEAIAKVFDQNGLLWAGEAYRGDRELTSNRVVHTPADLKGLKIRLPGNPDWIYVWKAFGALPSSIASTEVFSALQTGVVDAQENPITSNFDKQLWEVQKYTIMTNHIVDMEGYVISKKFYDTLDKATQKVILNSARDALKWQTQDSRSIEKKDKAEMESKGMKFVTVDLKPFQKIARGTLPHFESEWEPWVAGEVQKALSN